MASFKVKTVEKVNSYLRNHSLSFCVCVLSVFDSDVNVTAF